LPMQYAPLRGGDVPDPEFMVHDFPAPPRGRQSKWTAVLQAALTFWREASRDTRVSGDFRQICAANEDALKRWADNWALAN